MYEKNLKILSWAEEDRPREKLIQKGRAALSDSELLAIIIGSGSKELSAVELAKLILTRSQNNLNELAKLSVQDLTQFKGMGEAKAVAVVAAMEIGRRRKSAKMIQNPSIKSSADAFKYIHSELLDLPHEEFWILMLNRSNRIISKRQISAGGVSGTVVDQKMIFKIALDNLASFIILIHNHPSGNLEPSEADLRLTKKIVESGTFLDVPVLDHLIISNSSYFSFADEGLL